MTEMSVQDNYPGLVASTGQELAIDIGLEKLVAKNVFVPVSALRAQL